ncbi:hypothetical protein MYCTH_2125577 [Thermothelomyces thermophilus ATCC 42464]|uniref:Uncharacterized protein n=1 Tax=Thermothelomyces thermophilus (strain ATCC 42464 / BCRC 31852 / DSM 1799) TaxID=573729 RepID=G2Q9Y9_THET4|nr:uncharacterized protein MYCTH_2125577 [Thermothelomyces thermophilus ATCC 42464]AEO56593.1 hypothetical protein MYCTH_2125577 [Thermothelomyces thermophilus ATCC 42464]
MNGTRKEYSSTTSSPPAACTGPTWPSKERARLGNIVDPRKLRDEPSIALPTRTRAREWAAENGLAPTLCFYFVCAL